MHCRLGNQIPKPKNSLLNKPSQWGFDLGRRACCYLPAAWLCLGPSLYSERILEFPQFAWPALTPETVTQEVWGDAAKIYEDASQVI